MNAVKKAHLVDVLESLKREPIPPQGLDNAIGILASVVLDILGDIGPTEHAEAVEREMRPNKGAITSQSS